MPLTRRSYKITGIVQGVGFRPFVYRLAHELALSGWVRNSPSGVEVEIQGAAESVQLFAQALVNNAPPLAVISSITTDEIPLAGNTGFSILSSSGGASDIWIAPDSAVCRDCLRELFDPADRRYRYPFITCTNCGPRYSIITGTPYDRPKTTMADFPLCPDCRREYENPLDRRFHAQPIACHTCGPQLALTTSSGERIAERDSAVTQALQLLKVGNILAIKGIGGYHLAVDACNPDAVRTLRERKKRDEKPFAVMAATLEAARTFALMDATEERLLCSPETPIVIVRKRPDSPLSPLVAPQNGWLGLMLPYAPLHHLLFAAPFHPSPITIHDSFPASSLPCFTSSPLPHFPALVMTSGNISDEPVAFEDHDALRCLKDIADYFLLHDRPIHIRSDDSVMRVFQGKPLFYRRSRGYAPREVRLPYPVQPLLATGAELKSAVCLAHGNKAVLSQHIGDLQNDATGSSFSQTIRHLSEILEITPQLVTCDLHPDYLSSRFAEDSGLLLVKVQHHHAHLASCMAENGLDGDVIGVIFDGTGYGADGTVWGGEFLVGGYDGYRRAAHFRPTPLPGGDAAVREPWRMALSYLYQALGDSACSIDHPAARQVSEGEMALFASMLKRGINSPLTSSCGRLFDAVASLLNIRQRVSYDGQGAIELEALAETIKSPPAPLYQEGSYRYNVVLHEEAPLQIDFSPMITDILTGLAAREKSSSIARRFHQTIALATTTVCTQLSQTTGITRVVLSGGVFQNRLLSEMIYTDLTQNGLSVFTHRLIPPNDGGIALGQAAIAGRRMI